MIGENIRRIRKDKGLTQAYVARQAGITQAMLCWICLLYTSRCV